MLAQSNNLRSCDSNVLLFWRPLLASENFCFPLMALFKNLTVEEGYSTHSLFAEPTAVLQYWNLVTYMMLWRFLLLPPSLKPELWIEGDHWIPAIPGYCWYLFVRPWPFLQTPEAKLLSVMQVFIWATVYLTGLRFDKFLFQRD